MSPTPDSLWRFRGLVETPDQPVNRFVVLPGAPAGSVRYQRIAGETEPTTRSESEFLALFEPLEPPGPDMAGWVVLLALIALGYTLTRR